jgi:hypothetical protein
MRLRRKRAVEAELPVGELPVETAPVAEANNETLERVARRAVRQAEKFRLRHGDGVKLCAARKCRLPFGHDDGVHVRQEARSYSMGRRASKIDPVMRRRKPARPSGVALASPNSRLGKAQRAG